MHRHCRLLEVSWSWRGCPRRGFFLYSALVEDLPSRGFGAAAGILSQKGLQGHHRSSSGKRFAFCYTAENDVHGALSLQHMFWEKVRGGWLPLRPQARGGQLPAEQLAIDPQVVTYQSSPAHHRFPVEALAFLSSPVPSAGRTAEFLV